MNKKNNKKNLESDISLLLIELIKGMEIIYNPQHADYKDRTKKAKLWMSITNAINESLGCSLTVELYKTKWRSLRDHFVRHLRIQKETGTESKYKYHEQMAFLRNISDPADSEFIYISEDESETNEEPPSDISQVQIIKSDSSDSIHIDDTEYILDSDAPVNGANASNQNISMPTIVMPMPSAHVRPLPASSTRVATRHFKQVTMPNTLVMTNAHVATPPPPPPQSNNVTTIRNYNQNSESGPPEADEHEIFGELVVREMRKMTPDAKKVFKRNVTQLLYS